MKIEKKNYKISIFVASKIEQLTFHVDIIGSIVFHQITENRIQNSFYEFGQWSMVIAFIASYMQLVDFILHWVLSFILS